MSDDRMLAEFAALPNVANSAQWFDFVVADGVDRNQPGIYEWNIEGVGIYIGKYNSIRRPMREYVLNVERVLANRAYRRNKSDRFRRIHRELAKAQGGRRVTLTILENPPPHEINARERQLIAERGTLNGRDREAP